MELVEHYGPSMLRVAMLFVRTRAVAEEVVQDTWVGVLDGIGRFEGRSSFKTWLFRILTNTARRVVSASRGRRPSPFSPTPISSRERPPSTRTGSCPTVNGGRAGGRPRRCGSTMQPESRLLSSETLGVVRRVVEELPQAQKAVIAMRDLAGCSSEEVCRTLGISEGHQRVLLHRARTKVRVALEEHLGEGRR